MQHLISVIIVNYNTYSLTRACIESIVRYTADVPYEIILVDNASSEKDPGDIPSCFPGIIIKVVNSEKNLGFAGGNNLGISHAMGDIILLLNSDAYLTENSICITADFLNTLPDAGFVSCRLNYEDGAYQKNARKFRSIRNELLDLVRPLLYVLPYKKRAQLMLNQYFRGDFDTETDWLSGAFLMFRKEVLAEMPEKMLDERYFMYGEDHLWGYQLRKAGYKNYFTAATSVVHIANASTEPSKQLRLEKLMVDRELDIMQYRMGKGFYYYLFASVYTTKEAIRFQIKSWIRRLFHYRIR